MSGEFPCCMWCMCLLQLLYFAFLCSSCQSSPGHSSCSFLQLLFSWWREVWIAEGRGMGSESRKIVNYVNSSVHKFCKTLIIQDAVSYPNYTSSTFLSLVLRKTFFTENEKWISLPMLCCSAGGGVVLEKLQQIQFLILYKRPQSWNAKLLWAVDTVQSEFVVASSQMRNFSCGHKMSGLQWVWVCFAVCFFR